MLVVAVVTVAEAELSGFLSPRSEYIAAVIAAPPPALRQAIIAMDFDILKVFGSQRAPFEFLKGGSQCQPKKTEGDDA